MVNNQIKEDRLLAGKLMIESAWKDGKKSIIMKNKKRKSKHNGKR